MDEVNSLDGTNYKWANEDAPFEHYTGNNTGNVYSFRLLTLTKSAVDAEYICIPYSSPVSLGRFPMKCSHSR